MSEVDAYIESLMGERLTPLRNDTDRLKRELSSAKRDIDALMLKLEKIEKANQPEKEDDKLQPPASLSGAGDHLRIIGGEEYKTRTRVKYNGPFAGTANMPERGWVRLNAGILFGEYFSSYQYKSFATKNLDFTEITGTTAYAYIKLNSYGHLAGQWTLTTATIEVTETLEMPEGEWRCYIGAVSKNSQDDGLRWTQWLYGNAYLGVPTPDKQEDIAAL